MFFSWIIIVFLFDVVMCLQGYDVSQYQTGRDIISDCNEELSSVRKPEAENFATANSSGSQNFFELTSRNTRF